MVMGVKMMIEMMWCGGNVGSDSGDREEYDIAVDIVMIIVVMTIF